MIEEIDTNSNFASQEIPDGKNTFRVVDVRKAKSLYIFELSYDNGMKGEQAFFGNQLGPFLKVMGCKETLPGKYAFNSDELKGKSFTAVVYREQDKKDSSVIRQRMKDFDEVPF